MTHEPEHTVKIKKKWVDDTGVNIRWIDRNGNENETNLPIEYDEGDAWKEKLMKDVARQYAEVDEHKENNEMDMTVERVEDPEYEDVELDLTDHVERRRDKIRRKKTGRTAEELERPKSGVIPADEKHLKNPPNRRDTEGQTAKKTGKNPRVDEE